jgi:hypothetical protein
MSDQRVQTYNNTENIYDFITKNGYVFISDQSLLVYYKNYHCTLVMATETFYLNKYGKKKAKHFHFD